MDREVSTFVTGTTQDMPTKASPSKHKKTYLVEPLIGDRIRAARFAANKTQQELADNLYSKSYISAIERSKMTPSLQALTALAERLNVPVSYFFGETELNQSALTTKAALLDVTSEYEQAARDEAARLDLSQAEALIRQDRPREALEQLGSAPSTDLSAGERPRWYWLVGWAATLEGRPDDATRVLEEGFRLAVHLRAQAPTAKRNGLSEMVERLRCFLGVAACAGGQVRLALSYYRQCLAAVEESIVKEPELKLLIYKELGNVYWTLGWFQEAIGFFQKALEQADNLHNERQRGLTFGGMGLAYQDSGDLPQAEQCYRQALQVLGPLGNLRLLAPIRALLGQVLIKQEHYDEAEEQLRSCLESGQELGDAHILGGAWGNIAALHNGRGESDKAIQAANTGLQIVTQSKDHLTKGQLELTLAAAYETAQDNEAAERMMREAINSFEQTQDNHKLYRAHDHYAQFLAKQGRLQEAYAQMGLAHAVAARQPEHH